MGTLSGNKIAGGNPSRGRVDNDYYATNNYSTKAILEVEDIIYPALEPACGEGHISKLLVGEVYSTDLIYRKYGCGDMDFLSYEYIEKLGYMVYKNSKTQKDYRENTNETLGFIKQKKVYENKYINTVITNPPFNLFQEFVEKALMLANKKVIMFGKLQALEGIKRATFLETTPLKTVYVFKKRQQPLRNGSEIDPLTNKKWASSTMAFAWFIWEIGYTGEPVIKWI